ncbi:MAG: hypothetical protein M1824_004562 [Vezdaea acicularis]|nr:MAG: hypothetical protein M1824_004562 [Vezdaea acicularis]
MHPHLSLFLFSLAFLFDTTIGAPPPASTSSQAVIRNRDVQNYISCYNSYPAPDWSGWPENFDRSAYETLYDLCAFVNEDRPTLGCMCPTQQSELYCYRDFAKDPILYDNRLLQKLCLENCDCPKDEPSLYSYETLDDDVYIPFERTASSWEQMHPLRGDLGSIGDAQSRVGESTTHDKDDSASSGTRSNIAGSLRRRPPAAHIRPLRKKLRANIDPGDYTDRQGSRRYGISRSYIVPQFSTSFDKDFHPLLSMHPKRDETTSQINRECDNTRLPAACRKSEEIIAHESAQIRLGLTTPSDQTLSRFTSPSKLTSPPIPPAGDIVKREAVDPVFGNAQDLASIVTPNYGACKGRLPFGDPIIWPEGRSPKQYKSLAELCLKSSRKDTVGCSCPLPDGSIPFDCNETDADPVLFTQFFRDYCSAQCDCERTLDVKLGLIRIEPLSDDETSIESDWVGISDSYREGFRNRKGFNDLAAYGWGDSKASIWGSSGLESQGSLGSQCGTPCSNVYSCTTPGCKCIATNRRRSRYSSWSCGSRTSGKRDEDGVGLACPCNASYISVACCDADDSRLVWEAPELKLGELELETQEKATTGELKARAASAQDDPATDKDQNHGLSGEPVGTYPHGKGEQTALSLGCLLLGVVLSIVGSALSWQERGKRQDFT